MARILTIGDVLEIAFPRGFAYIAYAGRHDSLGDAVWVVPRVYATPTRAWESVFGDKGYFAFYPAHAAVRHKLVKKVDYSTHAIRLLPSQRRSITSKDENGKAASWLITEGNVRTPRRDEDLSEDERMLPIASIWNHEYLLDAIAEEWMPQ
jgi:hypothetical protein